jgi:hypothetical protein
MIELARAGADGLLDRVETVKNFHPPSLPGACITTSLRGYPPGGYPGCKLHELSNLDDVFLLKFVILKGLQLNSSF